MNKTRQSDIFNLLHPHHFATAVSEGDVAAVSKALHIAPGLINRPIAGYNGATALMLAAFEKQEKMVSFLLRNGADASLRDNEGMLALDYARFEDNNKKQNPEILAALEKALQERLVRQQLEKLERENVAAERSFGNSSCFHKPARIRARKTII